MGLLKNLIKNVMFDEEWITLDCKDYQDNLMSFCKENKDYEKATKALMVNNQVMYVGKYTFNADANKVEISTDGKNTVLVVEGKIIGRFRRPDAEKVQGRTICGCGFNLKGPHKELDNCGDDGEKDISMYEYENVKDAPLGMRVQLMLKK